MFQGSWGPRQALWLSGGRGSLYSDFLNYLEETKELAEEVPELYSDIILDNKNLVIDHQSSMSSSLWLLMRKGIMSTGSSLQV